MSVADLALVVNVIVGVFIPILVGVVTKLHASRGLKAILNALLAAATGILSQTVVDAHTNWRRIVVSIAVTWIMSVATHYGLWKPTGATDAVAGATGKLGIG